MSNYNETLENLKKVFTSPELEKSLLSKTLLIELKYLQKFCPSSIYLIPQNDSIQTWHGVIFIREGLYKDGIFKFRIEIPMEYPKEQPKVIFFSKVYHPYIDGSGVLNLKKKFPVWEPGKCFLVKVIYYINDIFYNIDSIYKSERKDITRSEENKIKDCVQKSKEDKYINDKKTSLKFSEPSKFHQLILDKILNQNKDLSAYDRIEDFKNWFMNNFMEFVQNNDKSGGN